MAAAPRINPLIGVDHPGSENGGLVFCEDSTSPLVVSKALMEVVCNQVNEGVWALPRGGGVEVGGLLIGAKSAGSRVTVERIVPITTEHRFGQAFHLSPTDLGGLEQTIASAHQEQSRSVVGFYRSRTRGDAIPRESDQEILNTLARVHPGYEIDFRFFLIFTPLSKSVVEISIAQRRDGGWHEWREVKLRTEPMAFISDVSETDSSLERAKYPGLALEPAAVRPPLSAPAPPAPPRPQERAGNKPRFWLYGAIALVIVAAATGANFWITTHPSEPAPLPKAAPPAESLRTGFAANPEGSMWKLTWNRDAVAALHANGAVLSIRDGANEQRVSLTEADLSTGTVFYTPQTGSLLFSLILLTPGSLPVEEHVRVLEAVRASTKPAEPTVQIQLDHQKLRTLRPFSDTSQPVGRKTAALEIAAPPVLPAANGAALNASIQLPMQVPAAPPSREAAVVSTPLPQTPAPVPVSAPIPQTPAAATTAPPLPQTPVGAAAQTLQPVPAKQPGYIAPKPIRQMSAMLPADAHATTSMTVQLRVEIDASGKVGKVTPTGRNATNFKLMDAAIRAAKFWVFEPAQENGHAVPSEIVLNFHFGAQ
jgi:TonB family protein